MKFMFAMSLLLLLLGTVALAAPLNEEDDADQMEQFQEEADEQSADDLDDSEDQQESAEVEERRSEPRILNAVNPCSGKAAQGMIVAGKAVIQTYEKMFTAMGCQWVLPGSTRNSFTLRGGCGRCTSSGSGVSCVGGGVAHRSGCDTVRGPDCKLYFTAPGNPAKPCPSS